MNNKILNTVNNIIQFKVIAPYSGCYWCWEFAFISEPGKIHFLIMESLREKCYKALEESLESNSDIFIYNVDDDKSIKEFIKECNPEQVQAVATALNENFDITLETKCPECGQVVEIHSMVPTSYKGDGGIGIEHTGFICGECYSMGCCSECGEFVGKENLHYGEESGEDLCEYCAPECVVCGDNTANAHSVCTECQEEHAEEFAAYEQLVVDKRAEYATPTFDGIKLDKVKPVFNPKVHI